MGIAELPSGSRARASSALPFTAFCRFSRVIGNALSGASQRIRRATRPSLSRGKSGSTAALARGFPSVDTQHPERARPRYRSDRWRPSSRRPRWSSSSCRARVRRVTPRASERRLGSGWFDPSRRDPRRQAGPKPRAHRPSRLKPWAHRQARPGPMRLKRPARAPPVERSLPRVAARGRPRVDGRRTQSSRPPPSREQASRTRRR